MNEVMIAYISLSGTAGITLIGWTARELYRTSKNQTALEHRVTTNERKIERLQRE